MTAPQPHGNRDQGTASAGFTLIEVLVAMSVMALLFAVLFGTLRLAHGYQERTRLLVAQASEFQITYRLMRRLLTRAFPLTHGDPETDTVAYAFAGNRNAVKFVAIMPAYPGQPGPQLFSFEFSSGDKGSDFRITRRPFAGPDDSFGRGKLAEDIILIKGPISGNFTYFGADVAGQAGNWRPDWNREDALPSMIGLHFEPRPGSGKAWPDLIVPMAIDMDRACVALAQGDEAPAGICRLGFDADSFAGAGDEPQ